MSSFTRSLVLYVGVSAAILLYVIAISAADWMRRPSGEVATESIAAESVDAAAATPSALQRLQSLAPRLATAAGLLCVWIVADLIAARALGRFEPFLHYLIRVLLGWGLFLALGAAIAPGGRRLLAALILMAVTAAFLGFWAIMLSARKRRLQREARGSV